MFLLLPCAPGSRFPRLAEWTLRHWLKHPRNLTSKCVTGCQCLYTWRRLVERIRITVGGSARDSLSRVRAGTRISRSPSKKGPGYFDIGPADFTPDTQISLFAIARMCSGEFDARAKIL